MTTETKTNETTAAPEFTRTGSANGSTRGARVLYQVMVDGAKIGPVSGWDGPAGIHFVMKCLYAFFMGSTKQGAVEVMGRIRAYSVTGGVSNKIPFAVGTVWGWNKDASPATGPHGVTTQSDYNKLVAGSASASVPVTGLMELAEQGKQFAIAHGLIKETAAPQSAPAAAPIVEPHAAPQSAPAAAPQSGKQGLRNARK